MDDQLKCPDCEITFMGRHFEAPTRCPRCELRTGAVVQLEPYPSPEGTDTVPADE